MVSVFRTCWLTSLTTRRMTASRRVCSSVTTSCILTSSWSSHGNTTSWTSPCRTSSRSARFLPDIIYKNDMFCLHSLITIYFWDKWMNDEWCFSRSWESTRARLTSWRRPRNWGLRRSRRRTISPSSWVSFRLCWLPIKTSRWWTSHRKAADHGLGVHVALAVNVLVTARWYLN